MSLRPKKTKSVGFVDDSSRSPPSTPVSEGKRIVHARRRSVEFNLTPIILTGPDRTPNSRRGSILSPRAKIPETLAVEVPHALCMVSGIDEKRYQDLRRELTSSGEITQFYTNAAPRRRLMNVTSDGSEMCYSDLPKKMNNIVGRAFASVSKKKRPLADAYNLTFAQVPAEIRGDHSPWLCFTIRFYTERFGVLKACHFGADDDQSLERWFLGLQCLIPMTQWHITLQRLRWQRVQLKLTWEARRQNMANSEYLKILAVAARLATINQNKKDGEDGGVSDDEDDAEKKKETEKESAEKSKSSSRQKKQKKGKKNKKEKTTIRRL